MVSMFLVALAVLAVAFRALWALLRRAVAAAWAVQLALVEQQVLAVAGSSEWPDPITGQAATVKVVAVRRFRLAAAAAAVLLSAAAAAVVPQAQRSAAAMIKALAAVVLAAPTLQAL
jgi:hypothetical protein